MERQATTSDGTYVSMDEAAELLQVSRRTVERRIADGSLPAYKIGDAPSSRVRLRVDAWVEGAA